MHFSAGILALKGMEAKPMLTEDTGSNGIVVFGRFLRYFYFSSLAIFVILALISLAFYPPKPNQNQTDAKPATPAATARFSEASSEQIEQ